METTGILLISSSETITKIGQLVKQYVLKSLHVKVSQPGTNITNKTRETVIETYKKSSTLYPQLDINVSLTELKNRTYSKINNKIDILISDTKCNRDDIEAVKSMILKTQKDVIETVVEMEKNYDGMEDYLKSYDNVVLGGTFDRLHTGHKILLTEALLRCRKRLTVGVTDANMLKSKTLWELAEPCEYRIDKVKKFLAEVDSTVEHNIVPISDPFGPTQTDPELELIVVSGETVRGGNKVNEIRRNNKLNALNMFVVDLVEDCCHNNIEEAKISSSNTRMRLLGTLLKEPQPNTNIPDAPYLIGLSGGIASGKSSISKRLQHLGAGIIDCDKIAHQLYQPNTQVYHELIQLFGQDIVASDGQINRRALGGIVFQDKAKLNMLNQLLWPKILQQALEESQRMYLEDKKSIIVMEAAVLLQAGWYKHVHEVWTSIIPSEEAVKRLMDRNGLSENDARNRLNSQPTNCEQVAVANVVFSTLWSYEFTQEQVERAWKWVVSKL